MLALTLRSVARATAIARIGLGIATILFAVEMSAVLTRLVDGRLRVPVASWFPEPTNGLILTYASAAIICGVAIALGFATRVFATVAVLVNVMVLMSDQQTYTNHGWLLTLLLTVFVFADSDRAWTPGAAARPRTDTVPWPQLLMMTQLSVCYLFAGLSKINSDFLSGEQFEDWLWWQFPSAVNLGIAWGTVAAELFLAFGLWFSRTRVLAVLTGVGLHASIVVMMREITAPLTTFALICLSLYPLFFAIRVNETSAPRLIIWDSQCSFCRRWVALFRFVDVLRLHRFVGSSDPGAFDDVRVTRDMAHEAIQLLTPKVHAQGFDAVRRVLAVSPLTFWTAPLLWLPPVYRLGDRMYRRVAARRTCKIG